MEVPAADPRQREQAERSAGLHDVMAAAQHWFTEQLDGVEGGEARAYLDGTRHLRRDEGTSSASASRPDSRGKLKSALDSFGDDKLVEAGMLIQPEEEQGTLRPLPRPPDVPDPRPARPRSSPSAAASLAPASRNI